MLNIGLQYFASGFTDDITTDGTVPPAPSIYYNNNCIAVLEFDERISLCCAEKKMNTDIEITTIVTNDVKVEVVYDEKTTVIENSSSAILKCAEKVMKSDIEIMASILNTYNISTVYSGCYGYSTNPTEIGESEEVTLYFVANEGYLAPMSIYVTGAEYSYTPFDNRSGGTIIITNPTEMVYISISCTTEAKKI